METQASATPPAPEPQPPGSDLWAAAPHLSASARQRFQPSARSTWKRRRPSSAAAASLQSVRAQNSLRDRPARLRAAATLPAEVTPPEVGGGSGRSRGRCRDGSAAAGARRAALSAAAGQGAVSEGRWPRGRRPASGGRGGPARCSGRGPESGPGPESPPPTGSARVARELAAALGPRAGPAPPCLPLGPRARSQCHPVVGSSAEHSGVPGPVRSRFRVS